MRAERCEKARANSRVTKAALWVLIGLVTSVSLGTIGLSQSSPVVRAESGELQGVVADGVVSFKGIPFAAPPVGDLRWRPPQPAAKWTGVRQAAEFGADCMQGRFGPPPGARAVRLRLEALLPRPLPRRLPPRPPFRLRRRIASI